MGMIGFDYTKHDIPEDDFPEEQVLPKGEYVAICTNITEGTNRMGSEYVKYSWKIQEGPFAGTTISNFENPDPTDEERHKWYMKRLKSLMTICGIQVIESLDQLQMIPVIINNKPYQSSNGQWSNSINYYKRFSAAPAQASRAPTMSTAPVQMAAPVQQAAPPVMQAAPVQAAVPSPTPQVAPQVAPQVTPQVGQGHPPQMVQTPPPAPAPQPVPPPQQAQPLPQQAVPLQQAMAQADAAFDPDDVPF